MNANGWGLLAFALTVQAFGGFIYMCVNMYLSGREDQKMFMEERKRLSGTDD